MHFILNLPFIHKFKFETIKTRKKVENDNYVRFHLQNQSDYSHTLVRKDFKIAFEISGWSRLYPNSQLYPNFSVYPNISSAPLFLGYRRDKKNQGTDEIFFKINVFS